MFPDQQQDGDRTPRSDAVSVSVWHRLREHLAQVQSEQSGGVDEKSLARRLADRAKVLRQRMERPLTRGPQQTYLAFNKQQERYGIALDEIAAVEALEHFTPVPNAASFIRGVTPWRGSILSLIDLGRLFGRPETGLADLRACVIVETAGRRLAIVAHEVEEIISISESELAPTPDLPPEISPEWVHGVHDQNRLILNMRCLLQDPRLVGKFAADKPIKRESSQHA